MNKCDIEDAPTQLGPEPEKPNWETTNIDAWYQWVNWHLDRQEQLAWESQQDDSRDPIWDQLKAKEAEELSLAEFRYRPDPIEADISAARYGDIGPLRRRYPHLKDFLQPTPRPRRRPAKSAVPPAWPESEGARQEIETYLAGLPRRRGFYHVRPNDPALRRLSDELRTFVTELLHREAEQRMFLAAVDTEIIKRLWKQEFGRQNRTNSPTAEEIAAKRWNVLAEALSNYRKKHHQILAP